MPADTWAAEFASKGAVVFPQRRSRLLLRLVLFLVLVGNSLWTIVDHVQRDAMSGAIGVLRVTALAGFVAVAAYTVWQLITRRPVIKVGRDGITIYRNRDKGPLAWNQIDRIGEPSGLPGFLSVQVHPVERSASRFEIRQDNVLELAELTQWLRTLHRQNHSTDN
ncbi:MAG: hypothetical protein QOF10_4048 [Kribbellaceae bacterium]|jgi:hypothetical protein|nr:hypothetical protein [Kribbellaceae bacterium]